MPAPKDPEFPCRAVELARLREKPIVDAAAGSLVNWLPALSRSTRHPGEAPLRLRTTRRALKAGLHASTHWMTVDARTGACDFDVDSTLVIPRDSTSSP